MKKVLVVRFSSIGDVVLTTPVLRCLHEQTGAEVHFLTKAAYAPLVAYNPHVQVVHELRDSLRKLLPELKRQNFDVLVDLHRNWRSRMVRMALGKPTLGFEKLNFQKWLLVNFKWDFMPRCHLVHRYLAAVEPLGVKDDKYGLEIFLPQTLPPLSVQLPAEYVAFAVGGAHATKRMPVEKMKEVLKQLDLPVVLLGGPAEAETGKALSATFGEGKIIDLCGRTTLLQSALVIRDAAAVLTHDTGMMHIAAAFRKPIVSVWGNTVPAFGMYPYYGDDPDRSTVFEVKGLPCRPCSKLGHRRCPRGHFNCMHLQDANAIARAVRRAISSEVSK